MKRSYRKPTILFENMLLKAMIAVCDYQEVDIGAGNTGINVGDMGLGGSDIILFFEKTNCDTEVGEGSCYHPPEVPEEWYNSMTGGGTPATMS